MKTSDKLLEAYNKFRPHINGHISAMNLFLEALKEVDEMEQELSKLHQPTVISALPDDEEIERKAEFRQRPRNPKNTAKDEFIYGFIQGAEWIIDMISSNEV